MTLNRGKLGHVVTFLKYLASVVSLIFVAETLIWNKITFRASNSLNLAELVINEPMMNMYKKFTSILFLIRLTLLNVKISRAYS